MLSNFEDCENIIHFGIFFASIGGKTYFLALGTIPITGVCFIGRKITALTQFRGSSYLTVIKICKTSEFQLDTFILNTL